MYSILDQSIQCLGPETKWRVGNSILAQANPRGGARNQKRMAPPANRKDIAMRYAEGDETFPIAVGEVGLLRSYCENDCCPVRGIELVIQGDNLGVDRPATVKPEKMKCPLCGRYMIFWAEFVTLEEIAQDDARGALVAVDMEEEADSLPVTPRPAPRAANDAATASPGTQAADSV